MHLRYMYKGLSLEDSRFGHIPSKARTGQGTSKPKFAASSILLCWPSARSSKGGWGDLDGARFLSRAKPSRGFSRDDPKVLLDKVHFAAVGTFSEYLSEFHLSAPVVNAMYQGSLQDTFCNHLKRGFFPPKYRETTIYKLQCSGV